MPSNSLSIFFDLYGPWQYKTSASTRSKIFRAMGLNVSNEYFVMSGWLCYRKMVPYETYSCTKHGTTLKNEAEVATCIFRGSRLKSLKWPNSTEILIILFLISIHGTHMAWYCVFHLCMQPCKSSREKDQAMCEWQTWPRNHSDHTDMLSAI